jgi:parvulin-like peptidyl-prolyl isomerase
MKLVTKLITSLVVVSSVAIAKTLITVNGTPITQQEVDAELMTATQGRFNQVPAEKRQEFRKQVLEQLVAKELVYGDAIKTGILKSKEFKREYVKVQKRIKKELAIQVWQKKELDKIKISNKALKDYYNKNKDEFDKKESVHARHILVKTKKEAKKIILSLKGLKDFKLKAKFIEEAKAKSTGPSGPKGGDLGYFVRGQMVPEFNDKVFSMKVGTISAPVKTQFGFHIIYLEDKKAKKTSSFKEVKPLIAQRLKIEKIKSVMLDIMEKLKKNAVIK